jgi:hydrogenase maturation protein HypF
LALYDRDWREVPGAQQLILKTVRDALAENQIVAVRGLGGFLLACHAASASAVRTLRLRKHRPHQPLAIMARDIEVVQRCFEISDEQKSLLQSPVSPILILKPRPEAERELALELISPDTRSVGVMIPTTPLHWLLFHEAPLQPRFNFLVMTSGNAHGEPICRTDDEARQRLSGLYDLLLTHDRDIIRVCDDSLYYEVTALRRARGMAPSKIKLPHFCAHNILAMGGDLKNTIALAFDDKAVLSPHIGDLNYQETAKLQIRTVKDLVSFFDRPPEVVAVDAHPDYISRQQGEMLANYFGARLVEVQHHHAHAVACLVENGCSAALALVFDGAGYGNDGTIWGGELFYIATDFSCARLGHLPEARLIGGEAAVLNPQRQAIERLVCAGVTHVDDPLWQQLQFNPEVVKRTLRFITAGMPSVATTSMGRLFDAVSGILGLIENEISYEGQAAIRLETVARAYQTAHSGLEEDLLAWSYPFTMSQEGKGFVPQLDNMILTLAHENAKGIDKGRLALKFHATMATLVSTWVQLASSVKNSCRDVVLSGGVFQNRLLLEMTRSELEMKGFRVLTHKNIPCGDGGIPIGQLIIAEQICTNFQ